MIAHLRFRVLSAAAKAITGDRIIARAPLRPEQGISENYLHFSPAEGGDVEVIKNFRGCKEVICEIASSKVVIVLEDDLGELSELVLDRAQMENITKAYEKGKGAATAKAASGFVKRGDQEEKAVQ